MWRPGVLVLLAGCSTILGIHDFEQTPLGVDAPDAPVLPACFRDDFDPPPLDASTWQATGSVMVANGQLVIPLAPSTIETRSVATIGAFDMTEGDIYVEVPQAVNQTGGVENGATVIVGASSRYQMSWAVGSFNVFILDEGTQTGEQPPVGFMPGEKLWRFSHRGNTVTLYTSSTGASWTTHVSHTVTKQPTSVTVELFAREYGANATPGEAHYDRVEVVTPACQ